MRLLDLHHRHPTCLLKGLWGLLVRESENAETAIWARELIGSCCRARAGGKEKYLECRHGPGAWQKQPALSDEKCPARPCHTLCCQPCSCSILRTVPRTSVIQPNAVTRARVERGSGPLVCCCILIFVLF